MTVVFYPEKVRSIARGACKRFLHRAGGYLRTTAKRSIRKRKNASSPGSPPSSHTGALRNFILYSVSDDFKRVVIGPTNLPGKVGDQPGTLELGGLLKVDNKRRRKRKIGDGGVISFGGSRGKEVSGIGGKKYKAVFVRIETDAQLRKVNENEEAIWGPFTISGRIAKRPYMIPALNETVKRIDTFWQVRRTGR